MPATYDPAMTIAPAEIPELFLAMWAAGMAGATAMVAWWRIVRSGFFLLMGVVVAVVATASWWAGAGVPALVAAGGGLLVAAGAKQWQVATVASAIATVAALAASTDLGLWLGLSGALALGGVTAEMLLGHWFLVDPTLPRRALRTLAVSGLVGTVFEAVLVVAQVSISGLSLVVFSVLAATTASLMGMATLALRESGYSGVMAATGLSYLAVLTVIGTVTIGRLAAAGTTLSFG